MMKMKMHISSSSSSSNNNNNNNSKNQLYTGHVFEKNFLFLFLFFFLTKLSTRTKSVQNSWLVHFEKQFRMKYVNNNRHERGGGGEHRGALWCKKTKNNII